MAQSGHIVRFYKARKTIISYLNTQGFVVDNYDNFKYFVWPAKTVNNFLVLNLFEAFENFQ